MPSRNGKLSIQIWDTGVGIPEEQLQDIFEEYHQLDNSARDRNLGLGLGLSIVRRLGILLDHPVKVRSRLGKGSVFAIEVKQSPARRRPRQQNRRPALRGKYLSAIHARTILIVEDDSEVRDLLEIGLSAEGHQVVTASDGVEALKLVERGRISAGPGYFRLQSAERHGWALRGGQTSREAAPLRAGHHFDRRYFDKDLARHRRAEMRTSQQAGEPERIDRRDRSPGSGGGVPANTRPRRWSARRTATAPVVYVVDDDSDVRQAIRGMLEQDGHLVEDYEDGESFLDAYRPGRNACLLIDANLPGISGLDLLKRLKRQGPFGSRHHDYRTKRRSDGG